MAEDFIFTGKRKGWCNQCQEECYVYKKDNEYKCESCGTNALESDKCTPYASKDKDFFIGDKYWIFVVDRFYECLIDSERKIAGSYHIYFSDRQKEFMSQNFTKFFRWQIGYPEGAKPDQLFWNLEDAIYELKNKSFPFNESDCDPE